MTTPLINVWFDPPKMDIGAPHPLAERAGDVLWLAYRTRGGDHFAVLRFTGVREYSLGDPNDERLDTHPLFTSGLQFYAFHEVREDALVTAGLRRWIATFHDDTLDVTAHSVEIMVRATKVQTAARALALVRGSEESPNASSGSDQSCFR